MLPPFTTAVFPLPGNSVPPSVLDDALASDPPYAWLGPDGEALVGFGAAARGEFTGADRFEQASRWWDRLVEEVDPSLRRHLRAFGSFSFSERSSWTSTLTVPRLLLAFGKGGHEMVVSADPATVDAIAADPATALELLAGPASDRHPHDGPAPAGPGAGMGPVAYTDETDRTRWHSMVGSVLDGIREGSLEKVVLARSLLAETAEPVSGSSLLSRLHGGYPQCWTYRVDDFLGSTPEMLAQIQGGTASAKVLAGTLSRSGNDNADALVNSDKEQAEHAFALDSLRQVFSELGTPEAVRTRGPYVLELPNVWHLASDVSVPVEASLPSASLRLVGELHPTAAVGGTPRARALEAIASLEPLDRGPYAGPVGYLDGDGGGQWGIGLRGAVRLDPTRLRLFAGCGIVAGSDPDAEFRETEAKFLPMVQALGGFRD